MSNPTSRPKSIRPSARHADHPQDLRGRSWSEHISAALDEPGEDWESSGGNRSAKEIIARQLVGQAMGGDKKAIEIILDRIEGRPRQAVESITRESDEVVEIG